jgi:pseudouridine-5'-monophosphatase
MANQEPKNGFTYKPVTHCIFDMDGLLIDSENYYTVAFNNVCNQFGKEYTWETKAQIMGTKALVGAEIVVKNHDLPLTPEEFMALVDKEYPKVFTQCEFMPGVERLLMHLKEHNIPMCIASSSKRETFRLKTTKFGEKFAVGYFFRHIVLASEDPDVKRSKPWPDTFLVAQSRFADNPMADQCLVFEDSVSGTIAGCRAKMQVITVPDPRLDIEGVRKKNPEFTPTLVIKSMEDFRPELFGLPPFPTN